jgi:CHRD domain
LKEGEVYMRNRLVVVGALVCVVALVGGALFVSGAGAATTTRVADLTGKAEAPGPGDPNGTGSAVITLDVPRKRVCFDLTWRRIEAPTRAHIHEAPRGEPGPIVVSLFENVSGADFIPLPDTINRVLGCANDVGRALIRRINGNPDQFYVNIHNVDFPAGAIRGQLRSP